MGDLACADRPCAVHLSVMTVADVVEPLVRATLGGDLPLRVDYWDGSSSGPADGQFRARFASRRALRRLLWAPIEGDLIAALSMLDGLADPAAGPGVRVDRDTRRAIARAALRLGILGPPPRPPREESRLRGRRHSAARDADAIAHHYDVGNDFYRLVLGPSMVYSCAYFEEQPSAAYTLEDAQRAKLDLVARKLGLQAGMRVLDVGCGWGAFVRHAAREYGVSAVGVTISREQAALAQRLVEDGRLAGQVEIRVQDYRAVDDGPYDAIASIGMAEHVGMDLLPGYASHLFGLLAPEGRLLNHAIARRPGPCDGWSSTSFIDRYVFPDGELEPLATMVEALEGAGLEVRDVESLREHYALTLRAWVANLEAGWDRAVALSSAGRARVWRLYMAGSALGFEGNRLGVNQVLAVRPGERGASGMPRTREALLH